MKFDTALLHIISSQVKFCHNEVLDLYGALEFVFVILSYSGWNAGHSYDCRNISSEFKKLICIANWVQDKPYWLIRYPAHPSQVAPCPVLPPWPPLNFSAELFQLQFVWCHWHIIIILHLIRIIRMAFWWMAWLANPSSQNMIFVLSVASL